MFDKKHRRAVQRLAIRLGQLLRALLAENRDKRLMIIGSDKLLLTL